jgi:putative transposase
LSKPIPLQYGRYYHIYNRGNNRQNIFFEDRNYRYFLKLYAEHIELVADTYAYCLLRNHFHLLVHVRTIAEQEETLRVSSDTLRNLDQFKPKNPSQQFGNLFNAYTKAINKTYNRTGSLFEHPFERIEVTSERYFARLAIYIHQNPQKHGLIDDFRTWPYSSYQALFSSRPTHLRRDKVLTWFGGLEQVESAHRYYRLDDQLKPLLLDDFD